MDLVVGYELVDVKNEGNVVLDEKQEVEVGLNSEKGVTFSEKILNNVRKWSAEDPYLYTLVITLKRKSNNSVIEVVAFRVGFRREEFTKINWNGKEYSILLFNGKPVIYKGVNIHEHDQKNRTLRY